MDVALVIRQRLEKFGLDQRELAQAAEVTESYISQLLTRRKAPPAPSRTDIYDKMDKFLKLPSGELARLAAVRRDPRVSLLVDEWSEDWSRLWWVRAEGRARVADLDAAVAARLAAKYPQYRAEPPGGPMIEIAVERWTGWSAA